MIDLSLSGSRQAVLRAFGQAIEIENLTSAAANLEAGIDAYMVGQDRRDASHALLAELLHTAILRVKATDRLADDNANATE